MYDRAPSPFETALRADPTRYLVYGLSLQSNYAIPGLVRAIDPNAPADVELTLHGVPASVRDGADTGVPFYLSPFAAPSGAPALSVATFNDSAMFRLRHWDGIESFVDRSGSHVWMDWPAGGTAAACEFLLGFVLGFVLRLRGTLCLHAAVVCGSRAVALAGPPGVGKSMLAAALGQRGYRILTDDVAAVTVNGTGYAVHPGPQRVRVRREGLGQLAWGGGGPPARWSEALDGTCADLDLSEPGFGQPAEAVALGSICLLEPCPGVARPDVASVRPAHALVALLSDTWATRLQDRTMRAQEFGAIGDVIERTPLYRLAYDPDTEWVSDACALMERTLLAGDSAKS